MYFHTPPASRESSIFILFDSWREAQTWLSSLQRGLKGFARTLQASSSLLHEKNQQSMILFMRKFQEIQDPNKRVTRSKRRWDYHSRTRDQLENWNRYTSRVHKPKDRIREQAKRREAPSIVSLRKQTAFLARSLKIPVEMLEELRGLGFTWTRIAEMLGVSRWTGGPRHLVVAALYGSTPSQGIIFGSSFATFLWLFDVESVTQSTSGNRLLCCHDPEALPWLFM